MMARNAARADARAGSAARSSTAPRWRRTPRCYRTESRWGLYHLRVDYPEKDDDELVLPHAAAQGGRPHDREKRAVEPYIVPIADDEKDLYDKQRIRATA